MCYIIVIMQLLKATIFLVAALVMGITASESVAAVPATQNAAGSTNAIGCYEQGTPRRPAQCWRPNCPAGTRSVFYDFGCPDGYKCCI